MNIDEEIEKLHAERNVLLGRITELKKEVNATALRARRLQVIKKHAEDLLSYKPGDTKVFTLTKDESEPEEFKDPAQIDLELENDEMTYQIESAIDASDKAEKDALPQGKPLNADGDFVVQKEYKPKATKKDPKPLADKPVKKETIYQAAIGKAVDNNTQKLANSIDDIAVNNLVSDTEKAVSGGEGEALADEVLKSLNDDEGEY